jgi:hypothetical protein
LLTDLGSVLSGVIAAAVILMGARYLIDPQPAADGFGIPGQLGDTAPGHAWLAVKAIRDIAIGIVIAILLINGASRLLGWLMLAVALVPIGDGTIVLRSGGKRTIAYGVHWATAALMLTIGALLIVSVRIASMMVSTYSSVGP